MFLQTNESFHAAQILATDYKFWGTLLAGTFGVYKAYDWVRQIRTRDVPDIKEEVKKLNLNIDTLGIKLDNQTSQVVSELKEMRSDFRTFYCSPQVHNPVYSPQIMPPVNAKPAPRKKRKLITSHETVTEQDV